MKYLRRYLSLFVCVVLLSTAFSLNANAEESNISPFTMQFTKYVTNDWVTNYQIGNTTVNPDLKENQFTNNFYSNGIPSNSRWASVKTIIKLLPIDKPLLKKHSGEFNVKISNITDSVLKTDYETGTERLEYDFLRETARALIIYTNGQSEYINDVTINNHKDDKISYDLEFSFTAQTDVSSIELHVTNNISVGFVPTQNVRISFVMGNCGSELGSSFISYDVTEDSKDTGLLKGIIEWLKGIKDGISDLFTSITEGFSNLGDGIKNVFDSILELPSKIWGFIENGLKALFVPGEDFLVSYKAKFENMLSDKLGAVYQVLDITFNSWDNITANDKQNTITIPSTTINLPNNNQFTFGGYNVQIVPNGFDFLATAIKTIVGILCTVMVVNGLRKRYDEIMGVEQ